MEVGEGMAVGALWRESRRTPRNLKNGPNFSQNISFFVFFLVSLLYGYIYEGTVIFS